MTTLDPAAFFDPIALAVVGGGMLLATVLRAPLRDVARAVAAVPTLLRRRFDAEAGVQQIAALARIARKHGVVALDRTVIADPDIAAGIADIVDGTKPELVGEHLQQLRRARIERHAAVADVWAGAAEVAPAMGMIGTLIGLVAMFTRMSDPAAIGGAMAVALLATLYGAVLANLVAMPIAVRLRASARAEAIARQRFEAPLVALAAREAPRPVHFVPFEDTLYAEPIEDMPALIDPIEDAA